VLLFESLTTSFKSAVNKIRFHDDEKALKRAIDELKKSLLKADVHYSVARDLLRDIETDTKAKGIGKENFLLSLKTRLNEVLNVDGNQGFVYASQAPTVVLMTGLQGSGKTTTTGKLAHYLKIRNKKVLIAACDLQRLAAVEQLRQIGANIEVDIFAQEHTTDPITVATHALAKAKEGLYDVLLVDSAGRLSIDDDLMQQLAQIRDTLTPHETFYVSDSLTGQDGVKSAMMFHQKIGISGVVLTKYDGDSKGGIALSIAKQIHVPLRFIGSGEKIPDLEVFIPERIVNRLMGAGDIQSLAEKTATVIDEKEAKKISKKIKKGEFNFDDFLDQIENIKKLGNIQSIVSMIPGMGNMANTLKNVDLDTSSEIKKIKAMVSSMTPKERQAPNMLNASRKRRIASGSGTEISELNRMLKQFTHAAKMAKKFSGKKGMQDFMNLMNQHHSPHKKIPN
jgi:signal recognition particle subunit SRP54